VYACRCTCSRVFVCVRVCVHVDVYVMSVIRLRTLSILRVCILSRGEYINPFLVDRYQLNSCSEVRRIVTLSGSVAREVRFRELLLWGFFLSNFISVRVSVGRGVRV